MNKLLIAAGLAFGLGTVALAPAEAAPIATRGAIAAPSATGDVACRMVARTTYRHGVRRIVRTRECTRDRRGPARGPRPGIRVHIN